jgi:hypothetical protein
VTRYLPDDQVRCSAYWYALRAGMVTGHPAPDEAGLEFLRELGLRAARLARWEGIPAVTAPEGPYQVYLWPERIWSEVADAMAGRAAEHGDWGPEDVRVPYARPDSPHPMVHDVLALDRRYRDPSCDRCNYDLHRCKGCGEPLPHGTEICAGCNADPPWCRKPGRTILPRSPRGESTRT